MRLAKGMMLDFIGLGSGLLVRVNTLYESGVPDSGTRSRQQMILTNRYECDVLVEGTVYRMTLVIHYWPSKEGEEDYSRIEWQVMGQNMWAKSGLAEVMWHSAKLM